MAAGDVLWQAYNTADDISNSNAFGSKADGSAGLLSEIDNGVGLFMFGDLEVAAGGAITCVGLDARIDVYLIPTYDGTNYPSPGGTVDVVTGSQYVGSISSVDTAGTVAVTNFTQGTLRGILLPPCKFKVQLVNELGATTNATMTVRMRRYGPKVSQS